MNWKRAVPILLIVTLFVLQTQIVAAQATTKPIDWAKSAITTVFGSPTSESENLPYLRFLFALLWFAVLFGLSEVALHGFPKGSRIAIAAILAVISAVLVPQNLFIGLATTYGALFTGLLYFAPAGLGLYVMFHFLKADTRFNHSIKAAIALVLTYTLGQLSATPVTSLRAGLEAATSPLYGGIQNFGTFATAVFFVLFIWHGFKVVMHKESVEGTREVFRGGLIAKWLSGRGLTIDADEWRKKYTDILDTNVSQLGSNDDVDHLSSIARAMIDNAQKAKGDLQKEMADRIASCEGKITDAEPAKQSALRSAVSGMQKAEKECMTTLENVTVRATGLFTKLQKGAFGPIHGKLTKPGAFRTYLPIIRSTLDEAKKSMNDFITFVNVFVTESAK